MKKKNILRCEGKLHLVPSTLSVASLLFPKLTDRNSYNK